MLFGDFGGRPLRVMKRIVHQHADEKHFDDAQKVVDAKPNLECAEQKKVRAPRIFSESIFGNSIERLLSPPTN
jgi:hypothetical protein